jgi:ribosomal protein S12 methylthiotransferase
MERVLAEANHLARTGCREINLIAQDVTQYGYDLYQKFTLPTLLKELNAIEGIDWVRILYFYPNRLTDEVIEAMATLPKVAKYIDIPLQHSHPDVLRRMKRPMDGERYLRLFEKVRAAVPDVAIRTTFIVGFPGETDEEFEHLIQFMKDARLDRVGAFLFSQEPGTPSFDMPGQVSIKVKKERYDKLMRTQQRISLEVNKTWIGRELRVLVDEVRDGWLIGRSHRDAPEIDGLVFARGHAGPGDIVTITIDSAEAYDLYGSVSGQDIAPAKRMTALRMAGPRAPQ